MEKYSASCRLILCCNSSSKVTEAIRSRCLNIRVNSPSEEQVSFWNGMDKYCQYATAYFNASPLQMPFQSDFWICSEQVCCPLILLSSLSLKPSFFFQIEIIFISTFLENFLLVCFLSMNSVFYIHYWYPSWQYEKKGCPFSPFLEGGQGREEAVLTIHQKPKGTFSLLYNDIWLELSWSWMSACSL